MTLESERERIQKWKDREKAKEFDTSRVAEKIEFWPEVALNEIRSTH